MKHLVVQFDTELDWQSLPSLAQTVIEQAVAIQQIPAPTFQEAQRAKYVAAEFRALALHQVETDAVHNVYGLLPGKNQAVPGLMISAHTDTVFAPDANLQIRTDSNLIHGPGLGDNSIGVAGILGLAQFLQQQQLTPACDLWFVATSREEGMGDLGGMKAAFARLKDRVQAVINVEGMALGHVYCAGTAVRRLHITASAQGGHSWLNFGRPSAIHGLLELGARITSIRPVQAPRTTYNIGVIEGGQSINTIASQAGLWLDLRSEDPAQLALLEQEVRAYVAVAEQSDLHFQVELVGDRPSGFIVPEHPLVQGALAALEQLGLRGLLENGSTDANVPLAVGCPAVTVGITRGSNAHRLDEYIETPPVSLGLRHLIILTLAAASYHHKNQGHA
ncbi:MAG TPA: M20/M25/M40 family metallo-hydrolase [Phototrophicaceae bacterium]|nr:M20/M25/M40 family metallo-hydrolase [Phototrophicaceae bacterium]